MHKSDFEQKSDTRYNALKFSVTILIPMLTLGYTTTSILFGNRNFDTGLFCLVVAQAILGILVQASAKAYSNSPSRYGGVINVSRDGGGVSLIELEVNGDPEGIADLKEITFKVN
jgi:hypothetical protein